MKAAGLDLRAASRPASAMRLRTDAGGIGGSVRGNNIQQVRTHPGIGQVRSDAGTHGSRAEDSDFLNSFQHR